MKGLFSLAVALIATSFSFAQSCNAPQSAPQAPGLSPAPPAAFVRTSQRSDDNQVRPSNLSELTAAEREFAKNGPKLYTMDEALAISDRTGVPVVCWVSTPDTRVFSIPEARKLSRELGETTLQAVMIDNTKDGLTAKGPRVQFSDKNYKADAQVKFIPVSKFDKDTSAKILAFARGGK